jgi:hypothetical protein
MMMILQKYNVIMIVKRDKLVCNFVASWKVCFEMCKLLQCHFYIIEQNFFNLVKDQNMQKKKNATLLYG